MKNYFDLCSTTPTDEKCAQLGEKNYDTRARLEANAYLDQIQRIYGDAPEGSIFQIIECNHEFGIYLDIRFHFDDEDQLHMIYFDQIQKARRTWDNTALEALRTGGYETLDNIRVLNQRAA